MVANARTRRPFQLGPCLARGNSWPEFNKLRATHATSSDGMTTMRSFSFVSDCRTFPPFIRRNHSMFLPARQGLKPGYIKLLRAYCGNLSCYRKSEPAQRYSYRLGS